MQQNELIRIIPKRIETNTGKIISPLGLKFGEKTNIEIANTKNNYLTEIKKSFNLNFIKSYLLENEIFLTIDCMNTPISNYLLPILAEIGMDDSCLLNRKYSADFNGKTPTPNLGMKPTYLLLYFNNVLCIFSSETNSDFLLFIHSILYNLFYIFSHVTDPRICTLLLFKPFHEFLHSHIFSIYSFFTNLVRHVMIYSFSYHFAFYSIKS